MQALQCDDRQHCGHNDDQHNEKSTHDHLRERKTSERMRLQDRGDTCEHEGQRTGAGNHAGATGFGEHESRDGVQAAERKPAGGLEVHRQGQRGRGDPDTRRPAFGKDSSGWGRSKVEGFS